MAPPSGHFSVARLLKAAEAASPAEAIDAVAGELGHAFGAVSVSFLIADLSGRALVRLAQVRFPDDPGGPARDERREARESATLLPFDGGPAEEAVRTQRVQVVPPNGQVGSHAAQWQLLAPVTERGEAIGLLELFLPEEPTAATVTGVSEAAHLLAFIVVANRRHTDLYEWGQRTRAFTLSAEIQQRLLPESRTCEASAFTLSGWLEPAASIGGDTFDYSLERDLLHLSLTDAMGHGVTSALTATICVGSLRGSRRRGRSLLEQAHETNAAVIAHGKQGDTDDFATGMLGRLDLRTGELELVNAGHVAPYLGRDGNVTALDLPVDLPFGIAADSGYRSTTIALRREDRLVFVTDGMLERNVARLDLHSAIRNNLELHPRETVRALADSALEAAAHALSDDATVLCLAWHGGHEKDRTTSAGADPERASEPRGELLPS